MTGRSTPRRVVVVGGGVLGVSTAQQLARAGAAVTLVTESELVSQASGRSLSWLNSAGVRSEHYHRLRMAGIDRYRTLAAQHPGLGWLRFDGGLAWPAEADELGRQYEHEQASATTVTCSPPSRSPQRVPGVNAAAVPASGALWRPGEGWVDLPSLVGFLAEDFVQHGGAPDHQCRPRPRRAGGRCCRRRTQPGAATRSRPRPSCSPPVPPCRAWLAELGLAIPDASPVALLVTTRPVPHGLTAVLNTPRASLRPRPDGGLAVDAEWATAGITRDRRPL